MALNKDRLSDYIDKETEAISGQPGGTDDIQEESVNKYEKLDKIGRASCRERV